MKIVIVGAFPPFRGGIANFNHTLAESLSTEHKVHALNFTTQYPDLLFPGKSQYNENKVPGDYPSERKLSSINPLTWSKTANRIIALRPDLIIIKYWMPYFAPAFTGVLKNVKRELNVKALVICDNIIPHEKRIWDDFLTKRFFNLVDHFLVMSRSVENDLLTLYPDASYVYTPHPLFDLFGSPVDNNTARKELGITEEKLLLYFGLIRPYKGLDILIKTAKILKEKMDNFRILAVGDCYEDQEIYRQLIKENDVADVFDLRTKFIPNEKVHIYFSAADLVVLPYKSATQSGVVPIAYHFNKPVVVSAVGGLKEIVENGKTGYVVQPTAEAMANGILTFFQHRDAIDFQGEILKFKSRFSWAEFIRQMLSLVK